MLQDVALYSLHTIVNLLLWPRYPACNAIRLVRPLTVYDKLLTRTKTEVKEESGALLFSHRLTPGVARASYGLQVAALAGVPASVISRARALLNQVEQRDVDGTSASDEIVRDRMHFL